MIYVDKLFDVVYNIVEKGNGIFDYIWGDRGYTAYSSYKNGASVREALFCGGVAAACSTVSISNLANFQGPTLDLVTNATVDLVFGTANNSISAATYKVVTDKAESTAGTSSTYTTEINKDVVANSGKKSAKSKKSLPTRRLTY